ADPTIPAPASRMQANHDSAGDGVLAFMRLVSTFPWRCSQRAGPRLERCAAPDPDTPGQPDGRAAAAPRTRRDKPMDTRLGPVGATPGPVGTRDGPRAPAAQRVRPSGRMNGVTPATRSHLDPGEDARLVERCRAGDARAWEALVRRYERLVYAVARTYRL